MKAIVMASCLALVGGCGRSSGSDAIGPDNGHHVSAGDDSGTSSSSTSDTVVEVACDGGTGYVEAAFPGTTEQDLERVRVVAHYVPGSPIMPAGYEWAMSGGVLRDGFVGFTCSPYYVGARITLPAR